MERSCESCCGCRPRYSPLLGAADPALAQKDAGPALEVRVRSVNDLLDKAEYLGDIANQAETAKQAAAFVRGLTDEKKGIEGVDPARPFGLYGSLTPDVVDSPVVLMIPVADEKAVLDLLTARLEPRPEEGRRRLLRGQDPNVPVAGLLPVRHKYSLRHGRSRRRAIETAR